MTSPYEVEAAATEARIAGRHSAAYWTHQAGLMRRNAVQLERNGFPLAAEQATLVAREFEARAAYQRDNAA